MIEFLCFFGHFLTSFNLENKGQILAKFNDFFFKSPGPLTYRSFAHIADFLLICGKLREYILTDFFRIIFVQLPSLANIGDVGHYRINFQPIQVRVQCPVFAQTTLTVAVVEFGVPLYDMRK